MIKSVKKYLFLFFVGGILYLLIEFISRHGHTHWVMGIVGGICFLLIGAINETRYKEIPFWIQCILGGVIVTFVELISGVIINKVLGMNVWDYSDHTYHYLGQICLDFTILWCVLSSVAIVLDDYLRYWFFGEKRPHYRL